MEVLRTGTVSGVGMASPVGCLAGTAGALNGADRLLGRCFAIW